MHIALKVAAIGVALTAGFYGPQAFHAINHGINQATKSVNLDDYCLLSSAECIQNNVSMTLAHDTAQPLIPTKIDVVWQGAASDTLNLSLHGLEMEMGTARFQLKRVKGHHFQGEVILPVCTMDKMTWVGELTDGVNTIKPSIRMER